MEHVGMDLAKMESQIAILTEAGELIEKRMRTEHDRLVAYFKDRPKAKILIEASTISEWVARLLEELGHEVGGGRSELRADVRAAEPAGEDGQA